MNVAAKLALSMGVVCLALLVGKYAWDYHRPSYRFRMTVEVETPQGLRSGSSVLEIYAHKQFKILPEAHAADVGLRGEAVAIELPAGTLFVTLHMSDGYSLEEVVTRTLDPSYRGGAYEFLASTRRISSSETRADLPRWLDKPSWRKERSSGWPMMARFRDIDDAKSIEMVDPNNISTKFGEHFSIGRIRIETTKRPITTGLSEKLPIPDAKGFFNWDGRSNPSDPLHYAFSTSDFFRGSNR